MTASWVPARPFSFTGARTSTVAGAVTTMLPTATVGVPTPRWTVAVYEPGLEHVTSGADSPAIKARSDAEELADASLALAEDVVEANRLASSINAAEVLEAVASRLRRGEILLHPGASTKTDAAAISAVLAALIGGRR